MMRAFKVSRTLALAAVALGVLAIVGAVVLIGGGSDDEAAADGAAGSTSTATTTIKRQDLVETETEDGTLGYADTRSVVNRLLGTVTWLPATGRVVRTDRALYKVDGSPVILMNGRVPAYRPLGPGVSAGADVRQLERSLRATGHDPDRQIDVDRSWDGATTAAVLRWQDAHGLSPSGVVEPGRVVFLPGTRRVASTHATLGGPAARGPLLTTTSTRRLVTVALDTTKSALARRGLRVSVELPSGRDARGRISSVGKVATPKAGSGDPSSGSSSSTASTEATIEVKIRLVSATEGLDRAPVSVRFEKARRKDVLAIPVTALLARPGGRFAVQRVEAAGERRIVTVKPGLYAGGYVEITGAGLRPGQRVTNAAVR